MEMCLKMMSEFKKNEAETKSKGFLVFIPYIPLVLGSIFLILGILLNAAVVKILWISVAGLIIVMGVFIPVMINKMFKGMQEGMKMEEKGKDKFEEKEE